MASNDSVQQSRLLAGRIRDARGRVVFQLDPVLMALLRRGGGVPLDVVRTMAGQIGLGMTKAVRFSFWLGAVGLAFFIVATAVDIGHCIIARGGAGLGEFVGRLGPFAGACVGPLLLWALGRRVRSTRITDVMLDHRRCPRCGYDIRGLPVDPADGATVCPECGCAWKLDGGAVDAPGAPEV